MALMVEMEQKNTDENGGDANKTKWVLDSSLDHKGRIPLRSSTGTWKTSFFIIAIEFSERLSYFAIASNLITYLTKVMHQDLTTAAKNVNCWSGVTTVMPLLGGFIADAYVGRFLMILLSSSIYLMGLGILTMSQFIPKLKPCGVGNKDCLNPTKIHEIALFIGIYLLSLGTGGHKPSLESFGADQFDDDNLEERKGKMSFFNWWNATLCCAIILGVTVLAYVEDNYGWGTSNLILTITMFITIVIFYSGKSFYRYRVPQESPLSSLLQVLVAAFKKRKLPYPSSIPNSFYEPGSPKKRSLSHTNKLKFLDKACIVEENEISGGKKPSPWKLSTLTKVEETKLIINMVPIWLATLMFGVCVAQGETFFVKQSSTMDRKLGKKFVVPPASIHAISAVGTLSFIIIYDKIILPILRRITGNERGIPILHRVGIGMFLSTVSIAVAAIIEKRRLSVAKKEGNPVLSMSFFWLIPQHLLLGIGNAFALVGLQEYFYEQVPDSMRSIGIALYLSVLGTGSFLSSFLITFVDHVSGKFATSWFGKDLNSSRLDKFYWLMTALSGSNFCIFMLLAKSYTYKNVQRTKETNMVVTN